MAVMHPQRAEPIMPDEFTTASTRRNEQRYSVRKTYSLEAWMDHAIVGAALTHRITQSDVVRECLEYGLAERFNSPRP
jgi:hypothetical protein